MTYKNFTFEGRLEVAEADASGIIWEVLSPISTQWDGGTMVVPKGFKTDFASIPRLFRSIIPVLGPQNWAALFHDRLYVLHEGPNGETGPRARALADRFFLDCMKARGVGYFRRWACYGAVRAGGGQYWNKKGNGNADD